MSGSFFMSQVPMYPGASYSVLGTPLQVAPDGPILVNVPKSKLPLRFFGGRPVVVEDLSLNGLGPCGETDVRVAFRIPRAYLDNPNVGGTVVQKMTMFWIVIKCATGQIVSFQPLAEFWEGFEVLRDKDESLQVDEWWLSAPPAGDGTLGTAFWKGVAAYFPGVNPIQCGLSSPNTAGWHPLSGNKPSSRTPPPIWRRGPLPESNVATRQLTRTWFCCPGHPVQDSKSYDVYDVSKRWVYPEEPSDSTLLGANGHEDHAVRFFGSSSGPDVDHGIGQIEAVFRALIKQNLSES